MLFICFKQAEFSKNAVETTKSCENVWWFHNKCVPLQPLTEQYG